MDKRIYLLGALLVILATFGGVAAMASYKTTINVITLQGEAGKIGVTVYINYGPFGGKSPLSDAEVWVISNNTVVAQGYTNSSGMVSFTVQPGVYKVAILPLHIDKTIDVEQQGASITVSDAYLYS